MTKPKYNRRDFMKAGLAGMAVNELYANTAWVSTGQAAMGDTSGKKDRDRPNIILFFTDQQRLSALGAYGKTVCKTPVLDKLAAEGVLFENAYTCSNKDELYDLDRDPHEMTNRLEDPAYAKIADMMRRRIYTFMVKTNYPGANNFRLSRLAYSNERQYVHGPDPVDAKSFLVEDMEI